MKTPALLEPARRAWRSLFAPQEDARIGAWVFLRALGLINALAFVSLWVQIEGLIGPNGILPCGEHLAALRKFYGSSVYWNFPTLCWLSSSSAMLHGLCACGTLLAGLLFFNIAPALCLPLLWACYLSLVTAGQEFLGFQWDNLLLEAGLLAIFFAPLRLRPDRRNSPAPARMSVFLIRWLLFRLMFQSGMVKLISGDPTWWSLTALEVHYQTQPLPTWVGWHFHHLPAWFHYVSAVVLFAIELGVPFLILGPRSFRRVAFFPLVFLQFLIALTGNYGFFNLLTVALCVPLLDDGFWPVFIRKAFVNRDPPPRPSPARGEGDVATGVVSPASSRGGPESAAAAAVSLPPCGGGSGGVDRPAALSPTRAWPAWVLGPFALLALALTTLELCPALGLRPEWPWAVETCGAAFAPLRSFNGYGLFASMTTQRLEIELEGSADGRTWRAYAFPWKPGDLKRAPAFCEPYMPRLDWQMWFAALGGYTQNRWLLLTEKRLLEGSREVAGLFEGDPFPDAPPKYLRAVLYDCRFASEDARAREGLWWTRKPLGLYSPVLELRDGRLIEAGAPE
ncbi:MAG: lipase maturation factor family protein [Planctomycetes bacterium]|nr:lipase maturation factor family protein [Planctomycetota bacterium]